MLTLRTADLAARVVAWHNRHPLARRISPAQVVGMGVVSLPFALREAAPDGAAAETPVLTPIFDAQWMYGADATALQRFALAHGTYPLDAAAHWPWRHVDADLPRAHEADAQGLAGRTARHLLSAVIEVDGRRSRVLVAPSAPLNRAAMFGRRLFDPRRVTGGIGTGAVAASLIAGGLGLLLAPHGQPQGDPVAAAAAPAASSAVAASGHAPHGDGQAPMDAHGQESPAHETVAVAPAASMPASAGSASHPETPTAPDLQHAHAAPQTLHAAQPAADASATLTPTDVSPMLQDAAAAGPLVRIRPTLTEDERRQARLQAEALRPPPTASSPAQSLLKGTVYALATPPLRSRDDAQAQQVLLHSMKAQVATPVPTHLDVMAAGPRWRVVWWPHPKADDAERLRLEASARGLKLEVIAF